ncbi:MAG: hypothetical protein JST75_10905 [Bacteroidetes bacterium]|nr:hypothetical protein [Bacteroidota bacterium]
MRKILLCFLMILFVSARAQEKLIYHDIQTDSKGTIIPWFNPDPGVSFDHIVNLVWNFWDTMRVDPNGIPLYMNHQVWKEGYDDPRGLGGDQLQMAMSSWLLLYPYTGNERVKQNMRFMAEYYLSHGMSDSSCKWPNLPFPYNTLIYSGMYDGDMVIGPGFLQPDKSGSLGLELVHMYKMMIKDFYVQTPARRYLAAAIKIAKTLNSHLKVGDRDHSPLPFKVNAFTGETGELRNNNTDGTVIGKAEYTSNWCSTMELFLALQELDPKNAATYKRGFDILLSWMKKYPLQNNRWGPFFEDVQGWSDTQINAVTFALFMLTHQNYFPNWKTEVNNIFSWVYKTLGNEKWKKYGVTVVNEQTVYLTPGESHTARQGSTELLYSLLSGDTSRKQNAILELIWASYCVDVDGKNRFPQDEVWLTDGYGDFVKHYLRAMDYYPELAPASANHILSSSSVIQQADYKGQTNKFLVPYVKGVDPATVAIFYRTFDASGVEKIRMTKKPSSLLLDGKPLTEVTNENQEGYQWKSYAQGGVLSIRRTKGTEVTVIE